MMVIQAWRRDFLQLLNRFICKFAISFHTFLWLTFHIIGPWSYRFGIRLPRGFFCLFLVIFPWPKETFLIRTYFCNYPQYPCLFDILFECNPNTHGQGTMSALPNQRLSLVLSKSDWCSVSFQPVWCRPHTHTRSLSSRLKRKHSQFGTFSQPWFKRTFSNCLFHNSPAKRWPNKFRWRGTTESSILDHDLGH